LNQNFKNSGLNQRLERKALMMRLKYSRKSKNGSKAITVIGVISTALLLMGGSLGTASGASVASIPKVSMANSVGKGEGALNIIIWAGYAENGSSDKTVNWVTPFTKATGCKVNAKVGNTSDEMVTLMKSGGYDGVSASGDATNRLIYGGYVAPVNTSLVPNYKTISTFLKNQSWNSAGGKMYGIPHGWGANVLTYNPAIVKKVPTSWGVVFDPKSPYAGKITAYDSPIYIADAALYLMKTKPALGIKNPYALDQIQFDAAVNLLKAQKKVIGEYWSDYTKAVQSFESKNTVLGTEWQVIANLINSDKKIKVKSFVPIEGATGWSDTWMISAKAAHPNCMYQWMNWITSPKVNDQVAEWFGEAPSQTLSCKLAAKGFCDSYHATDAKYAKNIYYWTTPTVACLDGRKVACKDYAAWTQAWTTIKG
jgi:putative spermidine/putrescine transport system substrate-binding protein